MNILLEDTGSHVTVHDVVNLKTCSCELTMNGQAALNMNFIKIHRGHENRQSATRPLE